MPTSASGLTFYEPQFESAVYQGLTQKLDLFNAASRNAIQFIDGGAPKGRQPKSTGFYPTSGLIQDRDPSGTGTLTPVKLNNQENISIKKFFAAPVELIEQDWIDMGMTTVEGTMIVGRDYGEKMAQAFLNNALSALIGAIQAIDNSGTAVNDVSATSTFSYTVLEDTLHLLGDHRANAQTMVSYSKPLNDFNKQAFTDTAIAMQLGSTTIYNGGMPTIGLQALHTDAAPLLVDNTGTDFYWVPVLVPGAVTITTGKTTQFMERVVYSGSGVTPENPTWLWNVAGEYEIKIRGAKWTASGTNNPNAAALATSSNWGHATGAAANVKHGPGVLAKVQ